MITSPTTFANETMLFFQNTSLLVRESIPERLSGMDRFRNLVDETFSLLLDELRSVIEEEIINALNYYQEAERTFNRKDAYDLLFLELNYFNTRYDYVNFQTAVYEMKSTEKLETASIALDSVSELFDRLPKWLQKIITVLSEILGIAKALTGG